MSTRSEREKAQKLNEQHQAILSKMLREDDNKHCADCEAKGPRWASWNLGVFMCIRCAGIHRNLGVHISRVKSVNLDQWTQEQIQSMVDMGNNKAKQLYEAHLPDTFRRPQTDQAVEFFIRDKYERKKYYDQNGLKTASKSSDAAAFSTSPASQAAEKNRQEEREKKKREKDPEKVNRPSSSEKGERGTAHLDGDWLWEGDEIQHTQRERARDGRHTCHTMCHLRSMGKKAELQTDSRANPRRTPEPAIDLLGLDAPAGGAATSSAAPVSDEDIFGPMVSNPLPSSNNTQAVSSAAPGAPAVAASAGGSGCAAGPQANLDLFSEKNSSSTKTEEGAKKPLSKDSILSLYSNTTVSPQPAAPAAAMYMGQPPMQQFPSQPSGQPNFQTYPGVGGAMPPTTMTGGVMPQGGGAMMGQNSGMMVGMAMPNGGYMGMQQGMMGPPGGAMPAGAGTPQMYAAMQQQQQQQGQWNVNQMTQQISGIAMSGGVAAPPGFVQPGAPMGGGVGPPSGQTLSTQLWK
ncbi:stromal membrane-associated protein 1 isoform X2 [Oncorhynchus mykiss]|uniref:stromal membrane-associated protein 1 isoform X2 n=1 Tax=Oncorhynchus mykiss TaxID=8022 RepID=UPI001878EEA0|nr:stromal membrane-associated protein 1 isoform X2 [Oncorhynchus mykiss]